MKISALMACLAILVWGPALPAQDPQGAPGEPGREPRKVKFLEFRAYVILQDGSPAPLRDSTAALRVEPKGGAPCVMSMQLMRPKAPPPIPAGMTGREIAAPELGERVVLAAIPPNVLDQPDAVPHQTPQTPEAWKTEISRPGPYFKADLEMPSVGFSWKGTLSYTSQEKTQTVTFEYPFPAQEGASPRQKPSK